MNIIFTVFRIDAIFNRLKLILQYDGVCDQIRAIQPSAAHVYTLPIKSSFGLYLDTFNYMINRAIFLTSLCQLIFPFLFLVCLDQLNFFVASLIIYTFSNAFIDLFNRIVEGHWKLLDSSAGV
jgi:hypothetical protein